MKIKRPPGPKGSKLWGNLREMRKDPLAFWTQTGKTYGDISFVQAGFEGGLYFINELDTIQRILVTDNKNFTKSLGLERTKPVLGEGLLTSEGEFHRRQRRLVTPAFHRKRIAEYAEIMSQFSREHTNSWEDGSIKDINEEMMALTLRIVGQTLYGADVAKQAGEVGRTLDTLMDGWWIGMLLPEFAFKLMLRFPLPMLKQFHRAIHDMDEIIYRLIRERRASGEDHGDLLSMLLHSVDEEEDGGKMTDQQARDEAITLFLAGHETTANALAWTWYLLSQHPQELERMQEEIDRVLQGRLPTMEDIPKLTYTEQIFSESMRLYPPAWALGRKNIQPYEALGYQIPAESTILISMYVVHHDPRYYPDPERFAPERWTPEAKSKRHRFAYFPFGGGLRRCIGEAFAWMEGVLVLATIAQQWKLSLVPGQTVEPIPRITLRAKKGIKMQVERR